MRPLCVFFDIGATLIRGPNVSPVKTIIAALEDAYNPDVIPAHDLEKDILTLDTRTVSGLAVVLMGYGVPKAAALRAAQEVWRTQVVGPEVIPGGPELLENLCRANIPYGFISNIWHPYAQSFERLYGELATRAKAPTVYSYRHGYVKPSPRLFVTALREARYIETPERCIMIGDTYLTDIAPALLFGMKTVHVHHRPEKEASSISDYTCGRLLAPDRCVDAIGAISIEMLHSLTAS